MDNKKPSNNNLKARMEEQWNALPEKSKRLIRLYVQFSEEDILKRMEMFVDMADKTLNNEKRHQEFLNQVDLYKIAYLLKLHKLTVKGGKRKTRRSHKKRLTRRRR